MGSNPILAARPAPFEVCDVVEAYLEEEPAPAMPQTPLVTSFDVRVPA